MEETAYNVLSFNEKDYKLFPRTDNSNSCFPPILYKYRDWDKECHKELIFNSELYFPSPLNFNDPFDCQFTFKFEDLNHEEVLNFYYQGLKKQNPHWTEEKLHVESQQRSIPLLSKDEDYIQFLSANYLKTFQNSVGVASFSVYGDNILLWSHYANNHKGICVGFDSGVLFNAIKGTIGQVKYVNEYPQLEPPNVIKDKSDDIIFSHFFKIFITKYRLWEYEGEYRIFKTDTANTSLKLPKQAFKQIIIGCEFPKDLLDDFINTIRNILPHAEILMTKKNARKFKLDFYRIPTHNIL